LDNRPQSTYPGRLHIGTLSPHVAEVWIFDNDDGHCWRKQTSDPRPSGTTIDACDNLQASMPSSSPWKTAALKGT